jgi:predicted metal-dependent phosphoesterase TrpH
MTALPEAYLDPFSAPGRWYRGNLHMHTTASDGEVAAIDAVAWYKGHNYDFLAVTDHDYLTDVEGLSSPGFLVLPGIETHPGANELGEPFHIVAAGVTESHRFGREDAVQDVIEVLRAEGAVVWLGHPYWFGLTVAEMMPLEGIIGIEVYNATCVPFGKGLSVVHWDDLLARGRSAWGLAVDDTHWKGTDAGQGWVMVKAPELSPDAILQSLAAGSFYASQGPEIRALQVTPSEVYVRCSPVQSVTCVSIAGTGCQVRAPGPDLLLTEALFPLRQQRQYVRIECTDVEGRTAWSQPVLL